MEKSFVEERDGGYWIAGTRISLDSVVVAFKTGLSPETIATECFPSLSLEQVYGAVTYYLGHREAIEAYLQEAEAEFEALRQVNNDSEFSRKMAEARRQLLATQP